MLKWMTKRSWSAFHKKKEDSQLKTVFAIMAEIFEKLTGISGADFLYDPEAGELVLNYLDERKVPISRNFSSLSDGYRELITLSTDIAWRMALLNPQLEHPAHEVPGIIMIDGIELHLHPKWQGKILGILRSVFPKIQFIVTTHSPFVIQSVSPNHLCLFSDGNSIISTA